MNRADILNATGLIFSVAGLVLAISQTLRYNQARKDLNELQRRHNADIWQGISLTLQAYETLDDARNIDVSGPRRPELAAKLGSARRAVVAQYVHQLRQATLDEPEFTDETVERWRSIGRLENEWRVQQARKFLRTAEAV